MAQISLAAGNLFPMLQFPVASGPLSEYTNTLLNLNQLSSGVSTNQKIKQTLVLNQNVSVNKSIQVTTQNYFSFNTIGVRTKDFFFSDLIIFEQDASIATFAKANNLLLLIQNLIYSRGLNNLFVINQATVYNIIKQLDINHELNFSQGSAPTIDNNWKFVEADKVQNTANYDPTKNQIPPTVKLPVKFISGLQELIHTNVAYGDQDSIQQTRISRRTRGEQLIIYRDPRWPITEILKFKLIDLSQLQGKLLLKFIRDTIAQVIKFSDWLGIRWLGVIINPEAELIQSSRTRFELEIQFQGQQIGYTINLDLFDNFTIDLNGTKRHNDASFLDFTQSCDYILYPPIIGSLGENTLVYSQLSSANKVNNLSITDTITLIDFVSVLPIHFGSSSNSITINGNVTVLPIHNSSGSNTLSISELATEVLVSSILDESSGYILLEDGTNLLTE